MQSKINDNDVWNSSIVDVIIDEVMIVTDCSKKLPEDTVHENVINILLQT